MLLALADCQGDGEAFKIRAEILARRAGLADRHQVQRALARLEALGLVTRQRTGRAPLLSVRWEAVERLADGAHPSSGAPHLMGRSAPSDGALRPIGSTTPSHHPSTLGEEWQEIEERLTEAGVFANLRARLLAQLQGRQVPAALAAAVVAHWAAHGGGGSQGAWTAGALVERLRALERGQEPGAGWPTPSPAWQLRGLSIQQAAERLEMRRAAEAAAARQEADRRELLELEARRGAELDSLPEPQRDALAERLLADNPFLLNRYRRTWQQFGSAARAALLEELDR